MNRRWLGAAALVAAGSALLAGCASLARRVTFHDPAMDFSLLRSVAVLPFGNLTNEQHAAERVRDVFMTMLQATGAVYVVPPGEVGRGISRLALSEPSAPTAQEVVQLGKLVNADAVITGTVREYGEVRSGGSTGNLVALSLDLLEAETGKVVWSASSSRGGISAADRFFGGGGEPMNKVTEKVVRDLLDKLFR